MQGRDSACRVRRAERCKVKHQPTWRLRRKGNVQVIFTLDDWLQLYSLYTTKRLQCLRFRPIKDLQLRRSQTGSSTKMMQVICPASEHKPDRFRQVRRTNHDPSAYRSGVQAEAASFISRPRQKRRWLRISLMTNSHSRDSMRFKRR